VLVTAPALTALADLLDAHGELPVYVAPQCVLNEIAGFNIHRGCVALGERPMARSSLDSLLAPGPRRLIVLEAVTNADNVGGIFRCAAALGGEAVLLGPRCCDPLYRKAIRTSIGASLHVPFATDIAWPDSLVALRSAGYMVVAFTPATDALPLEEVAGRLRPEPRLALMFGSEGEGLTAAALDHATIRVRIPVADAVDSLNVTAATAIGLYAL
jgi:tRNA G18 (ribose-2'-O)-methylase SpoU